MESTISGGAKGCRAAASDQHRDICFVADTTSSGVRMSLTVTTSATPLVKPILPRAEDQMVQGFMQRHFISCDPQASGTSSVATALWATCSHQDRGHLSANGIAMLSLLPAAIEVSFAELNQLLT